MSQSNQHDLDPHWVGIGASAGGLDALKELLSEIHDASNAIFIIAQHLDPKHPTILQDLLARITHLPITLVKENTTPQAGHIYLISPGHNAELQNQNIVLTPAAAIGPKPSINELFNSLAQDVADKAIGVILSGTGSDGAQGMIAIKAAGGITLAQDEDSARYSGMPRAARETGFVDLVLPPKDIAGEIRQFIDSASRQTDGFTTPKMRSHLEKIFQRIFDQTGYDFSGYKLKTIQRRIQRRMAVHKLVTLDDYITLVMASSQEVEELFKDMLISVTAFFRDASAFEDLAKIIEGIVEDAEQNASIRVWIPGCANGEEAYSIAILFQQASARLRKDIHLQIFATDIDNYALTLARRGVYSANQVKEVDPELLKHYFIEKDGWFHISKRIRDQVVFAKQNLIMDPPFSHLDLISCRNVLIYFNPVTQRKVFQIFHFSLRPEGYLFLGKSESASNTMPELFTPAFKASQIFKRRTTAVTQQLDHISSANQMARTRREEPRRPQMAAPEQPLANILQETLLTHLLPVAMIIDSEGRILHIHGDVSPYLSFPQGRIDTTIFNLARDDLKIDIRSLLQQARREGRAASQALFYQHQGQDHSLFLRIQRLKTSENNHLYALAFLDLGLRDSIFLGTAEENQDVVCKETQQRLTQEIAMFRDRLQSSIQDLETTNEELQSTNEELQSANEELQSANEELQTANEELQSTNEELSTVNEELEIKSFELQQVNNDLENMLLSIDEVILFVDSRLRVQRYTRKAAETFRLRVEDVKQPVTSLDMATEIPNLRSELVRVMEQETENTLPIRLASGVFQLRLVPYHADSEQLGVMMFFERGLHGQGIQTSNTLIADFLELFTENTAYAIIATDYLGHIVYVSEAALNLFGYTHADLYNQNVKRLMPEPYCSQHDTYLRDRAYNDSRGVVERWRTVTGLKSNQQRFMIPLRIHQLGLGNARLYIGLFDIAQVDYG